MLQDFALAGAPPLPCPSPCPAPATWLDATRLDVTLLDIAGLDIAGPGTGTDRTPAAARPGWLQGQAAARAADPPMAVLSASLRGPLTPIIGFAQLMQQDLPTRHRSHGYAAEIERAATGLLAMLDALLAEANGRALPPETEPEAAATAGDALRALRAVLDRSRDRCGMKTAAT